MLGLFIALLAWAPLPLASNRVWSNALLALLLAGLLVLSLGALALRRCRAQQANHPGEAPVPAWPHLFLLAFVGWVALAGGLRSQGLALPYDYETQTHLLRWTACTAAALLVLTLGRTAADRSWLMYGVVGAGVLQALLALVLFAKGGGVYLFDQQLDSSGRASGTFSNFDHLANYLTMVLSIGLGQLLAQFDHAGAPTARHWKSHVTDVLAFVLSPKMVVRLMLVLMVVALVLTRSRAGNGIFFGVMLLAGLWVMVKSRRLRKPAMWLVASLIVVDIVVIGQWVGLDKVVQRLEATAASTEADLRTQTRPGAPPPASAYREESLQERLQVASEALALVRQEPVWGHGGGMFYSVMPTVKSWERPWRFDHAHNDYVELAVDTGLVGLGLLLAFYGLSLWRAVRLISDQTPPSDRGIAVGVAMALLCAALHALFDFSLQITANAVLLTVLSSVVWCIPRPDAATLTAR